MKEAIRIPSVQPAVNSISLAHELYFVRRIVFTFLRAKFKLSSINTYLGEPIF
jgi:hypothetical protein